MAEILFYSCIAFVFYAYAGYPLALWALARFRNRPVRLADITPPVTLIITARNEEARIAAKIDNTLALDYPADRLDVVVASDCSTDRTNAIVEGYRDRGIRLVVSPERRGKEFAQARAIAESSSEIVVFSDVATRLDVDGLRMIVRSFADPTVGCVSSTDRMVGPDGSISGEGAYVRYEMFLRALETQLGSVIGLSGSFFAARRAVCQFWAVDLPSDFMTLINSLRSGLRGVSDPEAIGYYQDLADRRREFGRKVRTIVRGMAALLRHLEVLNPVTYGLAAWQLFSHKLCRWLVPFAMGGALAANLLLMPGSTFYTVVGFLHAGAYGLAAIGSLRREPPSGVWKLITFLVMSNLSILNAWFDLARGRRVVTWEPSRR